MSDNDNFLRYDILVETALRRVVKQALEEVIRDGMLGDHRFYITFYTQHQGVKIPSYLRENYPEEMTVVLQYQFYDLAVDDEKMSVTLSFNNVPENLVIPLDSISIFADPSVNFALQFQPMHYEDELDYEEDGEEYEENESNEDSDKPAENKGQVVSLDSFRKKNDKDNK